VLLRRRRKAPAMGLRTLPGVDLRGNRAAGMPRADEAMPLPGSAAPVGSGALAPQAEAGQAEPREEAGAASVATAVASPAADEEDLAEPSTPVIRFCTRCGNQLDVEDRFCSVCGHQAR
jgi:zinc-ribbon domain